MNAIIPVCIDETWSTEHLSNFHLETDLETLAATVCAFLNSGGGAVDIAIAAPEATKAVDNIRRGLQEQLPIRALWSVDIVGDSVKIVVPRGRDLLYSTQDDIYVRQNGTTVRSTPNILSQLIDQLATQRRRFERITAAGVDLEDLEEAEVRRTVETARKYHFPFRNADDIGDVIHDLHLTPNGLPTHAARILFGNNSADNMSRTRIAIKVFADDNGDKVVEKRALGGTAFSMYDRLMDFLRPQVGTVDEIKNGRVADGDKPRYPRDAVHEAVVNALVHRDYLFAYGYISVALYPDRLEIRNPGTLPDPLTVEDLKQDHPSLPTNPDIAHVFYLRGLMDRLGQGTQIIVQQCREAGLPEPQWHVTNTDVTLTMFAAEPVIKKESQNPLPENGDRS